MTKLYLLLGSPVKHSISPLFWNAAFDSLDLDAVYHAVNVVKDCLVDALKGIKALDISGANITAPYKEITATHCDILHGAAKETGIINTIKPTRHGIEGWNTDYDGLLAILSHYSEIKSALIMGDGASSKSVLLCLKKLGISNIFQIARKFTTDILSDNSHEIYLTKLVWNSTNFAYSIGKSDIIINTTSLGWNSKDELPELSEYLTEDKIYMDLNYSLCSQLIQTAVNKKCRVVDGYELLLQQGLISFKILTGLEPPVDIIKKTIYTYKTEHKDLIK